MQVKIALVTHICVANIRLYSPQTREGMANISFLCCGDGRVAAAVVFVCAGVI